MLTLPIRPSRAVRGWVQTVPGWELGMSRRDFMGKSWNRLEILRNKGIDAIFSPEN
jgi:hypothetical protein